MAQVVYEEGDLFVVYGNRIGEGCTGMVLPDGKAIMATGKGGRTGWEFSKGDIPENAELLQNQQRDMIYFELKLAFDAVKVAIAT